MPYMTNGKRDYKKENRLYNSKPSEKKKRAARNKARRFMEDLGYARKGDGKDVDHKRPISKGGSNHRSNLRMASKSSNRSFSRNRDSSLRSQRSKSGR